MTHGTEIFMCILYPHKNWLSRKFIQLIFFLLTCTHCYPATLSNDYDLKCKSKRLIVNVPICRNYNNILFDTSERSTPSIVPLTKYQSLHPSQNYYQQQGLYSYKNEERIVYKCIKTNNCGVQYRMYNLDMLHRERLKKMWRALRHTVGKPIAGLVTKVATAEGATTFTYTTKADIETALADDHKSRFTLASNAPLGSTPLYHFLGHLATSSTAQEILNGTVVHDDFQDGNVKE